MLLRPGIRDLWVLVQLQPELGRWTVKGVGNQLPQVGAVLRGQRLSSTQAVNQWRCKITGCHSSERWDWWREGVTLNFVRCDNSLAVCEKVSHVLAMCTWPWKGEVTSSLNCFKARSRREGKEEGDGWVKRRWQNSEDSDAGWWVFGGLLYSSCCYYAWRFFTIHFFKLDTLFFRKGCECSLPRKRLREPMGV